jgi:hypothetical protein
VVEAAGVDGIGAAAGSVPTLVGAGAGAASGVAAGGGVGASGAGVGAGVGVGFVGAGAGFGVSGFIVFLIYFLSLYYHIRDVAIAPLGLIC